MPVRTAKASNIAGMPLGRRSSRGKRRWYLVHAPEREQAMCDKVRKAVSSDVLEDAFVMRKERWRKRDGEWHPYPVPMHEDYFFVVTSDVAALDRALSQLTFPVRIAHSEGNHFAPLDADVQRWYEQVLDDEHVIRSSTAVIVDGSLHVQDGPLVGQESRVAKIDRHHRSCIVNIAEGADGSYTEFLPMNVPFKS